MLRPFILTVALLLISTFSSEAQSFNCRYAKTPAEIAICDFPVLGELDLVMAERYFRIPAYSKSHERRLQAQWLAYRDQCGYNKRCLEEAYRSRIAYLRRYYD